MAATLPVREKVTAKRVQWIRAEPIRFEEFLELFGAKENSVELLDGVVVEKPMVPLEHEKLLIWLLTLLHLYVKKQSLGIVLGSRTAVEINQFRGRLPDLLFVPKEQRESVQQKAIFSAPALVIELISPNDRRADIVALEADYRTIGVTEIVFIDQRKRTVRLLRKRGAKYVEEIVTAGAFALETIPGFRLETQWVFKEPRPDEIEILASLFNEA